MVGEELGEELQEASIPAPITQVPSRAALCRHCLRPTPDAERVPGEHDEGIVTGRARSTHDHVVAP